MGNKLKKKFVNELSGISSFERVANSNKKTAKMAGLSLALFTKKTVKAVAKRMAK